MKTNIASLLALLAIATGAHAQGSLAPPPGAPAPVMKSLDQIEARTPLIAGQAGVAVNGAGSITINQPGSYYLTGNVTITTASANGIVVTSNNVTLDLNGFSLICTSVNGGDAVLLNSVSNVRVTNGHISGGTTVSGSNFTLAGWNSGVKATSAKPGLVATDISVVGVRGDGILLSYQGSRVERCSTDMTGSVGIYASSISFCTARKAGSHGISASSDPDSSSVDNCFGETVGNSANGIDAANGSVSNSRGTANGGTGIQARNAINSTGVSTAGTGITSINATNCFGSTTSGTSGMSVTGTASFCRGTCIGGTALSAAIAIGCTSGGWAISSPQKHLGTP